MLNSHRTMRRLKAARFKLCRKPQTRKTTTCGMLTTRTRMRRSKKRYGVRIGLSVCHYRAHESCAGHGLTTAEAVTLAQQLVNRQKTKTELVNDGFNRYSLNSKDDLPAWFLDDESKHYKANLPVTKEAVQALRAKQRALDARPIKKIAEAKGRKKMRAARRIEKAMKTAEGVNASTELTEKDKAAQIQKLVNKGLGKGAKKKETKLVVAKGPNRGVKGRPKGVKGHYKMVDARMRKEVRLPLALLCSCSDALI